MRQSLSGVLDMVAEKVLAPTRFQAILLVEAEFHIRTKNLFYNGFQSCLGCGSTDRNLVPTRNWIIQLQKVYAF
jgi:hypothetical protein